MISLRLLALLSLPLLACAAPETPVETLALRDRAELFPLSEVRLLDGPFLRAQELNRHYMLALSPDRLLAPFRIEAGLEPKAPKYPNWESSGLDGHTAGHYLTALAQMWASTGDAEMRQRLDYMIHELAECQKARTDGYVGGIPRGQTLWQAVREGKIDFQNFSLNGAWVPWYNEHKLFAGLRDAWLIAGNSEAKEVLVKLADWCDSLLAGLSDEQLQAMLRAEHGGMNEVLADVASITGDPKYLALAKRFSHKAILSPLLLHQDKLTGLHANTQIPKVIGFARIAELGGDDSWTDAARFFWARVVEHRSLAFGGNSESEHFNDLNDFGTVLESRQGPETCNTYNMLRLSELLFKREPAATYADFYERALFNHILSSQNPESGGLVYFTPIRPRHYRVYSQPDLCFWCCVGSGMENHGKYGAFIYAHEKDDLYVNLFLASELDWREKGLRVRQETRFPDEERTRLTFSLQSPRTFTLRVRYPAWVASGALRVWVNGQPATVSLGNPASYLSVTREWKDGDKIDLELPMRTTLERLPDGSDYVALLRGPIVLAAKTGTENLDGLVAGDGRMAHVSPGPYLPLDQAPMLVGEFDKIAEGIHPVEGHPLTFTAENLLRPESFRSLQLEPFYRVHSARYMLYWRTVSPERYPQVAAELKRSEEARLELEKRTVDSVAPGEQQPEVEHQLAVSKSSSGSTQGRRWRDASDWFSYQLRAPQNSALRLLVTYYGGERGRTFDLVVADRKIATVSLDGRQKDRFVEVAYDIPTDAVGPDGRITVKFVAAPGSRTGSIFGLRLLRNAQ